MKKFLLSLGLVLMGFVGMGQTLRAVHFNPPSTDNGFEYIEITGTPNASFSGATLLYIDGDGANAGIIKTVYNIPSTTFGSNGLLLLRDAATVLSPAPSAGTTVVVQDFSPDLQNGTGNFILVTGFSGAVSNDLDTDNDGVLNTTPWTSVLSAVSVRDVAADATDRLYAASLGGTNIEKPASPAAAPTAIVLVGGVWNAIIVNSSSTNPGLYTASNAWTSSAVLNPSLVGTTLLPGNTAAPLPITLISFKANITESQQTILKWATASEKDNDYFEIERSKNALDFESVGKIKGRGTVELRNDYTFTDESPLKGINYYRLKQVDFDGQFSYTRAESVIRDGDGNISLFPNPTANILRINFEDTDQIENATIYNLMGRVVKTISGNQSKYEISELPQGKYILQIGLSDGRIIRNSFVKN